MSQFITLDFETYYDSTDFSLSKTSTEAYIRDPKFHVIGVSIKIDTAPAIWYNQHQATAALQAIDWSTSIMCAHNAMFDGAILGWHYNCWPKVYVDTLSMAQGLGLSQGIGGSLKALLAHMQAQGIDVQAKGEEVHNFNGRTFHSMSEAELHAYGEYCKNDVEGTAKLFAYLCAYHNFPSKELKVISETMRLFCRPVLKLDTTVLEGYKDKIHADKEALLDRAGVTVEQLRSDDKFAELLRNMYVEPPTKVSARTGKEAFAFAKTDQGMLDLLDHDDSDVVGLVEARLGNKSSIAETRVQRFIDIAARGALPFPLKYCAAHTGRFGGTDKINLQNLNRSSPLRDAICAPAGYKLVVSDSAQIEARMLAWFAGQHDLLAQFANGDDPYSKFATTVFGRTITKDDKTERFVGKTAILGLGYQMGAAKCMDSLRRGGAPMQLTAVADVVKTYRTVMHQIVLLWADAEAAINIMLSGRSYLLGGVYPLVCSPADATACARIELPNGLFLRYPNLRVTQGARGREVIYDAKKGKTFVPTNLYGGKLVENVIQALARIVITDQWLGVNRCCKVLGVDSAVVGQVHDELIACVPRDVSEQVLTTMVGVMSTAPSWAKGLPVACEARSGFTYGGCK